MKFHDALVRHGWTMASNQWDYRKGNWNALYDSGCWWIVATKGNPRLPDVEVTGEADTDEAVATWTVLLIEHLCALEDERQRLRRTLEQVRDAADENAARVIARDALREGLIGPFEVAGGTLPSHIVEHFESMATERQRFVHALELARDGADPTPPNAIATQALARCYHRWLVDLDVPPGESNRLHCPICGQRS